MERWEGKVAIVTGASVGIGPTLLKNLSEKGMKVVGLARLTHRLQELAATSATPGQIIPLKCDIAKEADILKSFKYVTENVGPVHVLINNAGLSRSTTLIDGATKDWKRVFEVNVIALCICTREAIRVMRRYNIAGHIVHMNSIAGHVVPNMMEPLLNVYPASKFAVTALTETLRQEIEVYRKQDQNYEYKSRSGPRRFPRWLLRRRRPNSRLEARRHLRSHHLRVVHRSKRPSTRTDCTSIG